MALPSFFISVTNPSAMPPWKLGCRTPDLLPGKLLLAVAPPTYKFPVKGFRLHTKQASSRLPPKKVEKLY
ncbi:MAG: hypothetical protein IPM10_11035 [Chitinophagaceae bacterium]|nr:hypothetical protein [Chitinophagaceae bacterium]